MSAQIEAERTAYYDVLERTQKGAMDVSSWSIWFLGCLHRAIDRAHETLSSVMIKAHFWDRVASMPLNKRQIKVLNRLLDGFEGKLTSSKYAKLGNCSQDTASRDIASLLEKGLLLKGSAGGRSTHYLIAGLGDNC
jgi:Fic family protein